MPCRKVQLLGLEELFIMEWIFEAVSGVSMEVGGILISCLGGVGASRVDQLALSSHLQNLRLFN